jgi:hypothetical protein
MRVNEESCWPLKRLESDSEIWCGHMTRQRGNRDALPDKAVEAHARNEFGQRCQPTRVRVSSSFRRENLRHLSTKMSRDAKVGFRKATPTE